MFLYISSDPKIPACMLRAAYSNFPRIIDFQALQNAY